ncbi:WxL domain-containing protein [Dellaglioa algida]|uniref:Cell surface protein n=1 Tax=Dellaglioa algida TaxID=105612 RepID=A0A5C6MFF4_9LACO|nr:WxL domain-containing protein [Dellaglioa algida]MDK1716939.1 WxL domain-containing protein [Dellaglioa algida]MDK1719713.1 WxL domain-containing protein [Dellaglioa algida]MDK1721826.1 WxL domain-containing protein [Dellaglioa algida]MDK1723056.1 WxL domain-containing protein [Dellaglioa algida]MDK1724675.1 WxL domain-containing protein [Dellaglioa algida]
MKTTKIVTSAIVLTTLGLVAAPAVSADNTQTITEKGQVGFTDNIDPTDPTDPTEPGTPIDPTDPNPGTPGPLSIDYISNLDFSLDNKVSGNTATYYAQPIKVKDSTGKESKRANYLQITDNRGTNIGWKLSVTQNSQFNNGKADLDGAVLKMSGQVFNSTNMDGTTTPTALNNGVVTPTVGKSVDVVSAAKGQGMGTWTDSFGTYTDGSDKDTSMKAVSLEVPGKTAKEVNTTYKTDLTWTLTDAGM